MTITTTLTAAEIIDDGIRLEILTTNTEYPAEKVRLIRTFADSDDLPAIKTTVQTLISKYWQIRANLHN